MPENICHKHYHIINNRAFNIIVWGILKYLFLLSYTTKTHRIENITEGFSRQLFFAMWNTHIVNNFNLIFRGQIKEHPLSRPCKLFTCPLKLVQLQLPRHFLNTFLAVPVIMTMRINMQNVDYRTLQFMNWMHSSICQRLAAAHVCGCYCALAYNLRN